MIILGIQSVAEMFISYRSYKRENKTLGRQWTQYGMIRESLN